MQLLSVAALMLLPMLATHAATGRRVALVIGNAFYAHAPSLANPLNDANDIAAALDRLGFAVTRIDNADQMELQRGLQQFSLAASASAMAVVFYAGHGIEVDKHNFLIPVDARRLSDVDVEFEAVPLDFLSRAVERRRAFVSSFWMPAGIIPSRLRCSARARRARAGGAWRALSRLARRWWPIPRRRGRFSTTSTKRSGMRCVSVSGMQDRSMFVHYSQFHGTHVSVSGPFVENSHVY